MVRSYRLFVLFAVIVLLGVVSSLRLNHNFFGPSPSSPNNSGSTTVRRANGISTYASSSDMGAATPLLVDIDKKKDMKLGVMLLNLGGPEKLEDVEGFLYNLFADPDIIRLPSFLSSFQRPLAQFISKNRAKKSSEAYESIGGGSPIVKYTKQQAQLLKDELVKRGFQRDNVHCYVAMRYWKPFTDEAIEQLLKDKVDSLVILPLYPQYSISTSGSSLRVLNQLFDSDKYKTVFHNNLFTSKTETKQPETEKQQENEKEDKPETETKTETQSETQPETQPETHQVRHTVVSHWYQRPGYLRSVARLILQQVSQFETQQWSEGVHVLFSAHGVPVSYIQSGDPYAEQMRHCVALVEEEVKRLLQLLHCDTAHDEDTLTKSVSQEEIDMWQELKRTIDRDTALQLAGVSTAKDSDKSNKNIPKLTFHLSYQSRVGPIQWLQPYTEEMLKRLGHSDKVKSLVVVPVSFVSEHVETLEEIDQEYREVARRHGVTHWRRVPALNLDAGFLRDLGELVDEAVQSEVVTVSQALSDNIVSHVPFVPLCPVRPQNLLKEVNKVVRSEVGLKLLLGGSVGVAGGVLWDKWCRDTNKNSRHSGSGK